MPARSEENGKTTASANRLMPDIRFRHQENTNSVRDSARLHQAYQILARSLLHHALAVSQQPTDDTDIHVDEVAYDITDALGPQPP